jgi:hypothetical protein
MTADTVPQWAIAWTPTTHCEICEHDWSPAAFTDPRSTTRLDDEGPVSICDICWLEHDRDLGNAPIPACPVHGEWEGA